MLQKPYGQEKNKPNRSYYNNDLSFPCSKKHNNYIVDYFSKRKYIYIMEMNQRNKSSICM